VDDGWGSASRYNFLQTTLAVDEDTSEELTAGEFWRLSRTEQPPTVIPCYSSTGDSPLTPWIDIIAPIRWGRAPSTTACTSSPSSAVAPPRASIV